MKSKDKKKCLCNLSDLIFTTLQATLLCSSDGTVSIFHCSGQVGSIFCCSGRVESAIFGSEFVKFSLKILNFQFFPLWVKINLFGVRSKMRPASYLLHVKSMLRHRVGSGQGPSQLYKNNCAFNLQTLKTSWSLFSLAWNFFNTYMAQTFQKAKRNRK